MKKIPVFALVFFFCFPVGAVQASEKVKLVMQNAVSGLILPGYVKLDLASRQMKTKIDSLCANPGEQTLATAKAGFSELAERWAQIELIRFGPVAENNRFERFLFYPDRKSTGLKQVQRILAKQDRSATDLTRLQGKSVAVQGMGALEFLLAGKGAESLLTGDSFRCSYARAITRNLQSLSADFLAGWQKGGQAEQIWTRPGEYNPIFRNPREVVSELLGTLVHGLEVVRDIRIGSFLRKNSGSDRPRVAIFRRSENTLAVISANIRAAEDLLIHSNLKTLLEPQDNVLVDNVIFELKNAQAAINSVSEPLVDALTDPEQRSKLAYVKISVQFAISMLDEDVAKAAGLSSGFSFSDGD